MEPLSGEGPQPDKGVGSLRTTRDGERPRELPAGSPAKKVRMSPRHLAIGHTVLRHTHRTGRSAAIFPLGDEPGFMYLMSLTGLGDGELVARCRSGDEAAWSELVTRFSRYVYAITTQAFRLGPDDAEEVFQEVFARAYEHLDRLRDDEAIRPWIAQLTRRLSIDRIRASRREELRDDDLEPPDVDETLEHLSEALAVRDALATLPEHCQEVLDRFFARDESYETIGAELEIASGTIASRISRCLAKLREWFEGRSEAVPASGERVTT